MAGAVAGNDAVDVTVAANVAVAADVRMVASMTAIANGSHTAHQQGPIPCTTAPKHTCLGMPWSHN